MPFTDINKFEGNIIDKNDTITKIIDTTKK